MKTASKILETVENRVRNSSKMKTASKNIDQRRQKSPAGWNSVRAIRQLREGHH